MRFAAGVCAFVGSGYRPDRQARRWFLKSPWGPTPIMSPRFFYPKCTCQCFESKKSQAHICKIVGNGTLVIVGPSFVVTNVCVSFFFYASIALVVHNLFPFEEAMKGYTIIRYVAVVARCVL